MKFDIKRFTENVEPAEGTPLSGCIFKFLPDLPQPPQKFINYVTTSGRQRLYPEENQGSYKQRFLQDFYGVSGPCPRVKHGALPGELGAEWEQWCLENIGEGSHDIGMGWVDVDPEVNPPSIGGHTDRTKNGDVLYVVNQGGPDAKLTFFREHGHDYLRTTKGLSYSSSENLDIILQIDNWQGHWIWLNSYVIHGIEGITEPFVDLICPYNQLPENLDKMING